MLSLTIIIKTSIYNKNNEFTTDTRIFTQRDALPPIYRPILSH
jgi:hypothetical protein